MTDIDRFPLRPPAPMEWHPAYQGDDLASALRDFLEGSSNTLRLAILRPSRLDWSAGPLEPETAEIPCHVLTRRKAWGPAPYVGRPFVYVWRVATDELGRSIAGEAAIRYVANDFQYDWSDPGEMRSS